MKVNFAGDLDVLVQRLCGTEPLNASLEIASHHVAKVVQRKIILFGFCLAGETERQIGKDDVFASTWKHLQSCPERVAEPGDQSIRIDNVRSSATVRQSQLRPNVSPEAIERRKRACISAPT